MIQVSLSQASQPEENTSLIPAGTFFMGTEEGTEIERPIYKVYLKKYKIAQSDYLEDLRTGEQKTGVKPTIAMGNETEMKIFQRIMWLVDSLASGLAFERKFVDVIDLSSEGIRAICGVDSKTAARIYELLRDEGQWVPQEVG